ncbi:MAG: hypothetical protein WDW36_001120 [Sanguina aurantia]
MPGCSGAARAGRTPTALPLLPPLLWQEANIHTMLSAVPQADSLVVQIKKTQRMLDDLDDTLLVFDTKLRGMAIDIGAIEASSNALELRSRNNGALLATLQALLGELRLPADAKALLEDPPYENNKIKTITRAARALQQRLARLSPHSPNTPSPAAASATANTKTARGGSLDLRFGDGAAARVTDPRVGDRQQPLSHQLLRIRAVVDGRTELNALAGRFVLRSVTHLRGQISHVADDVISGITKVTDRLQRLSPVGQSDKLWEMVTRHSELVSVLGLLEPASLVKLRQAYSASVSMLIRKQLRISVAELRKAASAEMHHNPVDYALTSQGRAATNAAVAAAGGLGGVAATAANGLQLLPKGGSQMGWGEATSTIGGSILSSSEHDDRESLSGSVASGQANSVSVGWPARGSRQGTALSRQSNNFSVVARGKSTLFDAAGLSVPLHEAWQLLLDGYVPHLLQHAHTAAVFLQLHHGDVPSESSPADAALYGISGGAKALSASSTTQERRDRALKALSQHSMQVKQQQGSSSGGGPSGSGGARFALSGTDGSFTVTRTPAAAGNSNGRAAAAGGRAEFEGADVGRGLSTAGRAVLDSLMAGVQEEFQVLVTLTSKSHQVLCLPMMAATTYTLLLLLSIPTARVLLHALAACHARLRANFDSFVSAQVAAIEGYGTRHIATANVKTLRVIAFISQFALLAHHTEMVLGLFAEAHADEQQQLPPPPPPVRRKPQHAVGGDGAEEEEEGREAATDLAEVVYAACSWKVGCGLRPAPALAADSPAQRRLVAVRAEVDLVYRMLAAKMFLTLEAVAGCDAKHGDRLRLENYGYFSESVRPLVRQSPALAPFLAQAEARKASCIAAVRLCVPNDPWLSLVRSCNAAGRLAANRLVQWPMRNAPKSVVWVLTRQPGAPGCSTCGHYNPAQVDAFHGYVEAQLEYGKLWPVMKLLDQLERVLQVATPAEVTYQPGCSTSEVKGLLSSTLYQPAAPESSWERRSSDFRETALHVAQPSAPALVLHEAEKKIAAMFVRVRKHCGSSTLAYRVWEGITERASGRYLRMEELLAECYPSLSLKPSSEEFDHMFKAVHS